MHTAHYFDLSVIYRGGFKKNIGNNNPIDVAEEPSFTQISTTSPLLFDSVNNTNYFPSFIDSLCFSTVDYNAHTNTETYRSINHVFSCLTIQGMNTIQHICELERTQLLTLLAMSAQNLQLAGYLSTVNRSNFLHEEGSTSWFYDCSHFFSPLCEADNCFHCMRIYYQDTVMYVDPIGRQTITYAAPISCDNNPQDVIALDFEDDEHYNLTPKPVLGATPKLSEPLQVQFAKKLYTFTSQETGLYSNTELTNL